MFDFTEQKGFLMYTATPPVALSPGELFVVPEKPVKIKNFTFL